MHVINRRPLSLLGPLGLVLGLATSLTATAIAQIDLPARDTGTDKPGSKPRRRPEGGNIAPHLTCTVCYERNYTTAIEYGAANGLQKAWCNVCRQVRLHKIPKGGQAGAGLDLPGSTPTGKPSTTPARPGEGAPRPTPAEVGTSNPIAVSEATGAILTDLRRGRGVDDAEVLQAADRLLAHGTAGVSAARSALPSQDDATMITAVRVLLRAGEPHDADAVVARLRTRMPSRAAAAAVHELVARDPVRATPSLMIELLVHPQQPVRNASERFLISNATPELLPLLAPVLDGKSSDARFKAVGILARIEDPRVADLLLDRLDDKRAKVARRAADVLAGMDDARIEFELLRRAFGERWILRSAAYALLTIIEREDRTLVSLLHEQQVPALLTGLDSSDAFIAGTCAAALAGIGFRTASPSDSPWLDRRVPERLVSVVAGFTFFDDYTSLREPALRRLKQIVGQSFGSDGPRWAEWWLQNADAFRPSRAVIEVGPGDERVLQVSFRSANADEGGAFVLLAPDAADATSTASRKGEVLYISESQAHDFVELMRSEGVFGLERLPGVRGGQPDRGRAIEIRLGDSSKSFAFGPGVSEPWFESLAAMARSLRDRNRWQRYPHPEKHGSRLGLFAAEGAWWEGDHDEFERARRLEELLFEYIVTQRSDQRYAALDELEQLYQEIDVSGPEDFPILLSLLTGEPYFVGQASELTQLARHASGLGDRPLTAGDELPSAEAVARGAELIDVLFDEFGAAAAQGIADILMACGPEAVRVAGHDPRPLMRAVAATVLARAGTAADIEVLLRLIEDPNEKVEIAAISAAGQERIEEARTELLLRSRYGPPLVRSAALRAAGELGGPDVRETLIANLTDPDGRFRLPAADGLASLADPATSSLLVSLLRGGERGELYVPARRGLLAIGAAAHPDLFVAMRSPSPALRREAALILAEQTVPESANALIRTLAEDSTDNHVSSELVILTCVDYRKETDPAEAWYRWWDGVVRDDANAWFRAACETRGFTTPPAEVFQDGGSEEGIAFLIAVMRRSESFLVERARRELSQLVDRDLGEVPADAAEREVWLSTLYEVLTETR